MDDVRSAQAPFGSMAGSMVGSVPGHVMHRVGTRPSSWREHAAQRSVRAAARDADASWSMATLDAMDHPMIVVDGAQLRHANRAAWRELGGDAGCTPEAPIAINQGELSCLTASDAARLQEAVDAAQTRAVRKFLMIGHGPGRVSVAVVPLAGDSVALAAGSSSEHDEAAPSLALVMLGRRQVCSDLSIFWYARVHGMTQAESGVLKSLCSGMTPLAIADANGVAISTVRTQLAAIRGKTGMASLRDLVNEVACLPPLVSALG